MHKAPNSGCALQRRRARLTLEAKRRVYDQTVVEAGFGEANISGAPKVLGDIVESLAAAVYLDSGRDLDAMWGVGGWTGCCCAHVPACMHALLCCASGTAGWQSRHADPTASSCLGEAGMHCRISTEVS